MFDRYAMQCSSRILSVIMHTRDKIITRQLGDLDLSPGSRD